MPKDPRRVAEKWKRNLSASTEDIRAGVDAVTEAPGMAAVRAQERMLRNLIEAINSGRWADAVGAVSLDEWKKAFKDVGIPRITSGATAGQPNMEAAMRELLPAIEAIQAELDRQHPRGDLEANINRSAEFARRMSRAAAARR